jgi:hypothetical protein
MQKAIEDRTCGKQCQLLTFKLLDGNIKIVPVAVHNELVHIAVSRCLFRQDRRSGKIAKTFMGLGKENW